MAVAELVLRPNIEHGYKAAFDTVGKFSKRDRLHAVALPEITGHDLPNLGDLSLGNAAHPVEKAQNPVLGNPVNHALAGAAGGHKAGAAKRLQMLGDIGEGQAGTLSQFLNAALRLRKMFEDVEPVGAAERPPNGGELGEQGVSGTLP